MDSFDSRRKVSMAEALAALPGPSGARFNTVFTHGSLQVEIYAPIGRDPQSPHTRDEVYVVASGHGVFVSDAGPQPFDTGDFLFAPAGVAHRFEAFSSDLVVWVLFYGPEGGERAERQTSLP